jgi:methionyl aminopeptidase
MNKRQQQRKHARRRAAGAGEHGGVATIERGNAVRPGRVSPPRTVPLEVARPPYVRDGGAKPGPFAPGTYATRMRAAGAAAAKVLSTVGAAVAPGVTTDELDELAHDTYIALGGYPSTLHYKGYEKSICTSVNEIICHGIPDDRPLADGDIVNCDITIYLDGVHGDTSATFLVGDVAEELQRLVQVTHDSMWRGIREVRPGAPINAIGRAIQDYAEAEGFSVVRTFVGHGIGEEFHTAPSVPHYFDRTANEIMAPGETFTIEPMINVGSFELGRIWRDGWTAPTADGLASAQFEHTVMVTSDGVEVLTKGDDAPPRG